MNYVLANVNSIEVANSPAIWGLAAVAVTAIIVQTILFLRLAMKSAKDDRVGLTPQQCKRAIRAGAVTAVGPSFSIFVVMIGLISVLGGPIAWLRLSVIGSASTELTASTIGVGILGGDLSGPLSMLELSTAWWTMTINACGWLVVTWIFASRMEKVRNKIGGGDGKWMAIFSAAATLGIFGAFVSEYIVIAVQEMNIALAGCVIAASASMFILLKLSEKFKWLKEYNLGFAMIAGIAAGIILG